MKYHYAFDGFANVFVLLSLVILLGRVLGPCPGNTFQSRPLVDTFNLLVTHGQSRVAAYHVSIPSRSPPQSTISFFCLTPLLLHSLLRLNLTKFQVIHYSATWKPPYVTEATVEHTSDSFVTVRECCSLVSSRLSTHGAPLHHGSSNTQEKGE